MLLPLNKTSPLNNLEPDQLRPSKEEFSAKIEILKIKCKISDELLDFVNILLLNPA